MYLLKISVHIDVMPFSKNPIQNHQENTCLVSTKFNRISLESGMLSKKPFFVLSGHELRVFVLYLENTRSYLFKIV